MLHNDRLTCLATNLITAAAIHLGWNYGAAWVSASEGCDHASEGHDGYDPRVGYGGGAVIVPEWTQGSEVAPHLALQLGGIRVVMLHGDGSILRITSPGHAGIIYYARLIEAVSTDRLGAMIGQLLPGHGVITGVERNASMSQASGTIIGLLVKDSQPDGAT